MTSNELKTKLDSMSAPEYAAFCQSVKIGHREKGDFIQVFLNKPELERRIAHILGIPTEVEKAAAAAQMSAVADTASAHVARRSLKWARISVGISVVALTVAIAAVVLAYFQSR